MINHVQELQQLNISLEGETIQNNLVKYYKHHANKPICYLPFAFASFA